MEHQFTFRENCVICGSVNNTHYLDCPDFLVTQQEFELVKCKDCSFVWTRQVPIEDQNYLYYQSDKYISHSNSKKGLFSRMYQWVRSRAISNKVALVQGLSNNGLVYDYGAGTGHFAKALMESGCSVKAYEIDSAARATAKMVHDINLLTPEDFFTTNDAADVITMWHVLEHVYHLPAFLDKLTTLVNQNGFLVLALPNHQSYDAKYYRENWAAYDVPRHLYHFTPDSVTRLLKGYGFKLEQVLPMKFDSFYVSMLSEEILGRNKWLGLWRGLISNFKAKNDTWSSQIYVLRKIS